MSTQQLKLAQEDDDEKQEWWYANGGTMTFITATEAEIEEIDADEYGALYSFNDERKAEEEEDTYFCEDCGKDFKWKSGTSSAGASVNDYHCGSCGEKAEEELDICGETGREFDKGNPLKGCGKKITEDDENVMIDNISYCLSCVENSEDRCGCGHCGK